MEQTEEKRPALIARGKRLALARAKRGYLTQAQLSDATAAKYGEAGRIKPSAIGMIEAGSRGGDRSIRPLAKLLDVSWDWLFDGTGPEPDWTGLAPPPKPAHTYSWRALRCAEIYDSIKDPALAAKALAMMTLFDERGIAPSTSTAAEVPSSARELAGPKARPQPLPQDAGKSLSPTPTQAPARKR